MKHLRSFGETSVAYLLLVLAGVFLAAAIGGTVAQSWMGGFGLVLFVTLVICNLAIHGSAMTRRMDEERKSTPVSGLNGASVTQRAG